MIIFPREGHGLHAAGEPWHRVERLQHIMAWFDEWTMGVSHPEYGLSAKDTEGEKLLDLGISSKVYNARDEYQGTSEERLEGWRTGKGCRRQHGHASPLRKKGITPATAFRQWLPGIP